MRYHDNLEECVFACAPHPQVPQTEGLASCSSPASQLPSPVAVDRLSTVTSGMNHPAGPELQQQSISGRSMRSVGLGEVSGTSGWSCPWAAGE